MSIKVKYKMPKEKIQKGSVYVETSKGIFPYEMLQKAEKESSSKQLEPTLKWMTANDLVPPPYNPMSFWTLYESNSVLFRCVNQLAIDVAGLGWIFQLREDKKDNQSELGRLKEFTKTKFDVDDSFRTILKKLLIDWGALGYFGLEVARNNKGDIAEVYHVPAHTLRVHRSKKKYCQIRNNKKVWFKKFGEPKNISSKTGKEFAGRGGRDRANELIFYKNYYPKSDYYGVPNGISATGDIMGMIGQRDYNLAFFENYGIPSALITLEGEWDKGSDKKVSDFLNKEIKGTANAHRTMVMMVPASSNELSDNKIKYEKLGVEVKESSFKLYAQGCKENILIAYSMPPERVGIRIVGKLGGNVAEEATKIYVQGVVEPLQLDLEEIINGKLLQSELYEFKFKDIDLRNFTVLVERVVKQVSSAILTPNEARNEIGLKPYAEGDKFYIQSTFIEAGEADVDTKLAKELGEIERDAERAK